MAVPAMCAKKRNLCAHGDATQLHFLSSVVYTCLQFGTVEVSTSSETVAVSMARNVKNKQTKRNGTLYKRHGASSLLGVFLGFSVSFARATPYKILQWCVAAESMQNSNSASQESTAAILGVAHKVTTYGLISKMVNLGVPIMTPFQNKQFTVVP